MKKYLWLIVLFFFIILLFLWWKRDSYEVTFSEPCTYLEYYKKEDIIYTTYCIDKIERKNSFSKNEELSSLLSRGTITLADLRNEAKSTTTLVEGNTVLYRYSNFSILLCQTVKEDHVKPVAHVIIGPLDLEKYDTSFYCN